MHAIGKTNIKGSSENKRRNFSFLSDCFPQPSTEPESKKVNVTLEDLRPFLNFTARVRDRLQIEVTNILDNDQETFEIAYRLLSERYSEHCRYREKGSFWEYWPKSRLIYRKKASWRS
jgi:hypothetical protein